ncbi:MAG: acyltransferase family protein [Xanthomonadaceae bacterium]|nr:acyltransferase family protein [Xanthomonadaceae bacterium]
MAGMFAKLRQRIIEAGLSADELDRIARAPLHLNSAGFDEWGLDPQTIKTAVASFKWLYKSYFRVETKNIDRLPKGRAVVVGNHGGQIPIDAMMVILSMLFEGEPPRIGRGMVERWVSSLPWIADFYMRCGQIVGDQKNCKDLLEKDETVVVFPEGVKGSGKTIEKKYQLQGFGSGFLRLTLETGSPVVPVAIIGHEEAYPGLVDAKPIAKTLGIPYLPITPLFPWLGFMGLVPLPTKIQIRYCEPIHFDANPDATDEEVRAMVERVRMTLQKEINQGLLERGDRIYT